MARAGADIVVGRGARVPRGIEWLGKTPILLGLGNLLGPGDPKQPWTERGFVVDIELSSGVPKVRACPYLVEEGRPARLDGKQRRMNEQIFRRNLERLSDGPSGSRVGTIERYACLPVAPKRPPELDGGGAASTDGE
jgi:hypothetical protein